MATQRTLACWICNKAVPINECKFDEHGNPVHEQCSGIRIALLNATRKPPERYIPQPRGQRVERATRRTVPIKED